MDERYLSFLGLCVKAGKLAPGHDAVKESLRNGLSHCVILMSDASQRLKQEMLGLAETAGVPAIETEITMDDMFRATHSRSAVVSINDPGFAKKLIADANRMQLKEG